MKITSYLYMFFVVVLYIANYFYLKINVFMFTGIVLASLIVFVIAVNVYVKLRDKQKGLHSDDFIFSPEVAKTIKKIDLGIQYETSIISTFFLIVGLLLFVIYTLFFTPYPIIMKIFITFNSLFAMTLMGSLLITNYQQFISYRESTRMFGQYTDKMGSEIISNESMFDIMNKNSTEISEEDANKLTDGAFVDLTYDKDLVDKIFENQKNNNNNNQAERRGN